MSRYINILVLTESSDLLTRNTEVYLDQKATETVYHVFFVKAGALEMTIVYDILYTWFSFIK